MARHRDAVRQHALTYRAAIVLHSVITCTKALSDMPEPGTCAAERAG